MVPLVPAAESVWQRPAALREELLAGLRVGPLPAGVRRAAVAATGGEQRRRREPRPQGPDPVLPLQPCGTPTADTASSRVG